MEPRFISLHDYQNDDDDNDGDDNRRIFFNIARGSPPILLTPRNVVSHPEGV